jgi:soluble lytic murein transglycosylase-like protein
MKHASLAVVVVLFLLPGPSSNAQSASPTSPEEESPPEPSQLASPTVGEGDVVAAPTNASSICEMVRSAAAANGLPLEFFARVIWQESRFRSNALGPVTRSGQAGTGHCPVHAHDGRRAPAA